MAKRSVATSNHGGVVQKCNGPECLSLEAVMSYPIVIQTRLNKFKIGRAGGGGLNGKYVQCRCLRDSVLFKNFVISYYNTTTTVAQ